MTTVPAVLKDFAIDPAWWRHPGSDPWGNGHTRETDPSGLRGWRGKLIKGTDLVLFGRHGMPGCFIAIPGDTRISILVFRDLDPKTVADRWNTHTPAFNTALLVPRISGWALELIDQLE
jgi:hypothetical protein